jgi:hypothetical protein
MSTIRGASSTYDTSYVFVNRSTRVSVTECGAIASGLSSSVNLKRRRGSAEGAGERSCTSRNFRLQLVRYPISSRIFCLCAPAHIRPVRRHVTVGSRSEHLKNSRLGIEESHCSKSGACRDVPECVHGAVFTAQIKKTNMEPWVGDKHFSASGASQLPGAESVVTPSEDNHAYKDGGTRYYGKRIRC